MIFSFTVDVAVIVAVPPATAVTTPFSSTVATSSSELLHVTVVSSVVSSGLYPTVRFTVSPTSRSSVVRSADRVIDSSGETTVTSHFAVNSPTVAVIVVVPAPTAVTTPFSTVAISSSSLLHVTVLSSVVSSGL